MSHFNHYYQAVKYLESLTNLPQPEYMQAKVKNLQRTKELIRRLKINLSQFKIIHLTGTAGKGSTVALLHLALQQAGKRVGSYYSPHPTTSIERIKVNAKYISPGDFVTLLNKIKPVINQMYLTSPYGSPSYFEVFLALALLYFQQQKCEYVVLETGCGGEFDPTNVVPRPLITAITNIGLDHTHLLGKTLEQIARTKAGIIKRGSIFLTTEQRPRLLDIFQQFCRRRRAVFMPVRVGVTEKLSRNLLLAKHIARQLQIKPAIIEQLPAQPGLPCRFESVQYSPRVILDGAHNYDKLKATFNSLSAIKFDHLWLIFTLNANKNFKPIARLLNQQLNDLSRLKKSRRINIYLTRHLVAGRQVIDLKQLLQLFAPFLKKCTFIHLDPWQALKQVLKKARQNDLILVTGSFYLAGELRQYWLNERKILQQRN